MKISLGTIRAMIAEALGDAPAKVGDKVKLKHGFNAGKEGTVTKVFGNPYGHGGPVDYLVHVDGGRVEQWGIAGFNAI